MRSVRAVLKPPDLVRARFNVLYSVVRSFVWIGTDLAAEYDGQGTLVSELHWGPTGEVAAAYQVDLTDLDGDGSTTDYVWLSPLYDGAFDCVGLTDATGAVVESYVHSYQGVVTITTGAGGGLATSALGWQQGFGGYYRDDETGLLYSVYRYYSPALGRFITSDPAGAWHDSANLGNGYTYVGNRHRNGSDPLGLDSSKCPCGKRYAVVVHNTSLKFNLPRIPLATGALTAAGNFISKLVLHKVTKRLDAKGYEVRPFGWNPNDKSGASQAQARYAKFIKDHQDCIDVLVVFGHGTKPADWWWCSTCKAWHPRTPSYVQGFGGYHPASFFAPYWGPNNKLRLVILGTCYGNFAGFQQVATQVVGTNFTTDNPRSWGLPGAMIGAVNGLPDRTKK